jgi:hypothetical protein
MSHFNTLHLMGYFVTCVETVKRSLEHAIYVECSYLDSKDNTKNVISLNVLNNFHQNIRDIRNKSDELIHSFQINGVKPYTSYLCKYIMQQGLLHLTLDGYLLCSSFCRQKVRREVCIFLFRKISVSTKLTFFVTVGREFLNLRKFS